MKYNQKKKKENIEIFLFIMVMAVFAAVLGVMSLGEKMQPVNQIRKISSGWYYYDNGKRTEVTLPDTIQAEKGEELILYNDGITDLDAGKVVTTRGAQYDLKIWLGDRPIYEYQDTTFVRNTQMKSKLECVGEIPTDMQNEPLKLVYSNPHQRSNQSHAKSQKSSDPSSWFRHTFLTGYKGHGERNVAYRR